MTSRRMRRSLSVRDVFGVRGGGRKGGRGRGKEGEGWVADCILVEAIHSFIGTGGGLGCEVCA